MTETIGSIFPQVRKYNLSNNDNDNASDNVNLNNTNTKTLNTTKRYKPTLKHVHSLAYRMADKLRDPINPVNGKPQHFAMYCGYAWKLPESRIALYLEMVTEAMAKGKAKNPGGLFTQLCTDDEDYSSS